MLFIKQWCHFWLRMSENRIKFHTARNIQFIIMARDSEKLSFSKYSGLNKESTNAMYLIVKLHRVSRFVQTVV